MAALPSGTVTFLFTDIEGSTRLLHELGGDYADALLEHRRLLREAFERHAGVEVDTQGDAFFVAFARASDAVASAAEAQRALQGGPIRVRMGIHTGEPSLSGEGYVGLDVHRASRICGAGHGGQVLIAKTTCDLLDSSFELLDLGEHRLKDIGEPVWIFQLGGGEFPPLRSLSNTNLPLPSSSFVGRERELAELRVLLLRDDVRLLTLTGAGGSGKTRLSLELGFGLLEEFANGVFIVQLAPLTDTALVVPAIAQVLGVRELAGRPLLANLQEHLADKRLLLVVDNCEHLLEAAPLLSELLAAAPELTVLATSRERLHLSGENDFPLAPLVADEAVELFAARAKAATPSFALDGNRADVAEICRRLDGLPLAVELAAARVKLLSTAKLLERLEQRLPLLVGGARDAPERQRTLRATIEWSYELLEPEEQELFARLAVFAGGCTLEAAEGVGQADLETVSSLVDKSLLRQSGDRFWMLETIREYALERLEQSGEAEEQRRRHSKFFLGLGHQAHEGLRGVDEARWLEVLEAEHDNLRAVLSRSDGDLQLELAGLSGAFGPFAAISRRGSSGWERYSSEYEERPPCAPKRSTEQPTSPTSPLPEATFP
ncbi:MAG: adenylate/guanylate cyclase domain-containing protein [Actinomycetota bacterium]|nr:adenylate/guanylate cyclase domain-containing protein [Actinomycetota bacterium]MDQ2980798.1 adenylate/guanylate cyclase domain-containing protein [Actinomycetota bacterium]